ncbi:MAG: hypothetical protein DWQ44_07785 [Bacteroidetes bacterium]|nr:MAG: hypothetical protein DWQ33_07015 [Bacteroidota bacterium]REJ99665.1 MAG: hypothetical protein DWQ39_12085 [Bacteroidota bacterium]REK33898.1 MAG: hypothetical protein DWQ44_07785 [Bacteroidota bacterium]REK47663.1 MAG: hypothetical protein DWQ48_11820 [Bacteroidota bacterium]
MTESTQLPVNFSGLEKRIQKLISLHEELKKSNQDLVAEVRRLNLELEEEKSRTQRMEEGYKNLKEVEKVAKRQTITQMKQQINDIISEIDKNMKLMSVSK